LSAAKYLRILCKLKLGLSQQTGTLLEEAKLIKSCFKDKSKTTALARLSLGAVVWHIWKEKNMRIFN